MSKATRERSNPPELRNFWANRPSSRPPAQTSHLPLAPSARPLPCSSSRSGTSPASGVSKLSQARQHRFLRPRHQLIPLPPARAKLACPRTCSRPSQTRFKDPRNCSQTPSKLAKDRRNYPNFVSKFNDSGGRLGGNIIINQIVTYIISSRTPDIFALSAKTPPPPLAAIELLILTSRSSSSAATISAPGKRGYPCRASEAFVTDPTEVAPAARAPKQLDRWRVPASAAKTASCFALSVISLRRLKYLEPHDGSACPPA